jgi:hypothetical protein
MILNWLVVIHHSLVQSSMLEARLRINLLLQLK